MRLSSRRIAPKRGIEQADTKEDERIEVDEEVAPQLEPPYDIEVTVRDGTDAAAISIANDY